MLQVQNRSALSSAVRTDAACCVYGESRELWTMVDPRPILTATQAGVTQLVECLLPKQNVVGSSPITRSRNRRLAQSKLFRPLAPASTHDLNPRRSRNLAGRDGLVVCTRVTLVTLSSTLPGVFFPHRRTGAISQMSEAPQPLPEGTVAPDFTLKATPDQMISLSDYRGRRVILAFYPADWSPTCNDQLALYQQVLPEFEKYNAQLLAISVDSLWCHKAYSADRKLTFPLLADFFPHGSVSQLYGTFNTTTGAAFRSLFVIDESGVVTWSYLAPPGINPGADGILSALEALPTMDGSQ